MAAKRHQQWGRAMDNAALKAEFARLFPEAGQPRLIAAPGRVNLIGEHTDYNDGFVCPMAIDRATTIIAVPRQDATCRLHSFLTHETVDFSIAGPVPHDGPGWSLYPRGVAEALRQKGLVPRGMDALVYSTVPLGGGLSSSASFEMATGLALLTLNGTSMPPMDLALAGVWAEHHYPKVPCGIMDQTISVMGQAGHALLLDCRDKSTKQVPLDDPKLRVVIANSNVKHELVQGEYTARRRQCEAVNWLKKKHPQIQSLRDATVADLEESRMGMDPTVFMRAHHVITEIARTTAFADALGKHDYKTCGKLMVESHRSLQNDYAVSCVELDTLVDIAIAVPGVYGARMTGGGFGGCIVALVKPDAVDALSAKLNQAYPAKFGVHPGLFVTTATDGARVVA
jgi:galactokinase